MEPSPKKKVEVICRVLRAKGQAGTPYRVAQLLNVSPSTVSRWLRDVNPTTPRGKSAEALDYLYRAAKQWEDEHDERSDEVLGMLIGGAGAALLGLGPAGMLIAAGVGWLVGDQAKEEARIKADLERRGRRP
tara:strand:- start:11 stop:406 length:396 start_codon:yes stop_codon:yes gene_type:complete